MNIRLGFKLFLYRFFSTIVGKFFVKLVTPLVNVKNLGNTKLPRKHPFLVIITIDTEAGYVEKNERRVWQMEKPDAFQGYYFGIRNLMKVFDKHNVKTTFFLSTQCFSSKGNEYNKIKKELKNVIKKGHEIGLHLHLDSDFSIQKKLSKKFDATSAFFYNYDEKLKIIRAAKELIKTHLGAIISKKLTSFRWGNWALDTGGVKALNKLGFKVDSSAIPGIKGHTNDTMKYDWSKVNRHYPWKLSTTNYQATNHDNSNILEIPIATMDFLGLKLRVDPLESDDVLNRAFIKYYNQANRSKKPFPFVVMTHSSEATNKDGGLVQALRDLDSFISFAKKYDDVEFVTLREAYERTIIS
jgi:peptidoglycan/xylan/chitin deacetylase (PgdA/CDA1 family)|tara:strand:- start:241 stop:1305 length:1065 start_codon:yes stop_codon:yes gene_type:complete